MGANLFAAPAPNEIQLGVLTLMPCPGLFICARLPIGDLVGRASRSVAAAQRRRAEDTAHAEVMKVLADFEDARPK